LVKSGLSKNEIAEKLGISRTALWKKTKKWC
jgi:biotin operon repressor